MGFYQPAFIDGTTQPGGRNCADRYELIQPLLAQYRRPFTLLDIGANAGYFALRAAFEFQTSIGVMIEADLGYAQQCYDLCRKQQASSRLILLNYKFSAADLIKLKQTEHFDIALCLSMLHHTRHKWQEYSEALNDMADYLIVENPPPDDTGAKGYNDYLGPLNQYWQALNPIVLGQSQRGTSSAKSKVCLYCQAADTLEHTRYLTQHRLNLLSNIKRIVRIEKRRLTNWINGINGWTFALFNGIWPEREKTKYRMIRLITQAYNQGHADPSLGNIILNGSNLILLDDGPTEPKHGLEKYIRQVERAFDGEYWKL